MFRNKKLWLTHLKNYIYIDTDDFNYVDTLKFSGEFKNDFPVFNFLSEYDGETFFKYNYYVENNKWYVKDKMISELDNEKPFLISSYEHDYIVKYYNRNIYNYILNNIYYNIDYHEKIYNKFIINLILTFKKFNLPISALAEPGKPLGFPIELIWNILSFLKLKDLIIK